MVTKYHKKVEDGLLKLGEHLIRQRRVIKVHRGSVDPLSLVDPRTKSVLNYQPDVYFILRNNKKLIFEVLDSEGKKQDIVVADIIRSFLLENVEALIFIHPGPSTVENLILEALKTLYKGLVNKGIQQSDLPDPRKTGPYLVTKEEAKQTKDLDNKLAVYAQNNKW